MSDPRCGSTDTEEVVKLAPGAPVLHQSLGASARTDAQVPHSGFLPCVARCSGNRVSEDDL